MMIKKKTKKPIVAVARNKQVQLQAVARQSRNQLRLVVVAAPNLARRRHAALVINPPLSIGLCGAA
jgi:hypothetical protein